MERYDDGAYDVAGKWTSKLNEGKTQIDAVVGYHRGFTTTAYADGAENVPFVFYNYDRSLYDFADLEGEQTIAAARTTSPNDPYPNITNCPVFGYSEQGIGLLENRIKARTSVAVVGHPSRAGRRQPHLQGRLRRRAHRLQRRQSLLRWRPLAPFGELR